MSGVEIRDTKNNIKGTVELPAQVFGLSARNDIMHASVVNFLANQRQGTHSTKTKGLVSGGGRKPYKQKHTGRARAGSSRSPIWRGGGTIFGPQPRDYSYSLPKNVKKRALGEALSAKLQSGEISFLEGITIAKPRTKDMVEVLKNLGLEGKTVLFVLPEKDENVVLSARNIPGVKIARARDINPYEVLKHEMVVITRGAVAIMSEVSAQ